MKLLYGVQGTGNGHIARARMMAKHFAKRKIDVQFLFSGRAPNQYFDMEIFGDYWLRSGLTFVTVNGRVSNIKSLQQLKPLQFIRDLATLDLSSFDLIITDFEPLTAWAARRQNKDIIGIGHQYAMAHQDVPSRGADLRNRLIMRYFAPCQYSLGLHWDRFNASIVPPIINPEERRQAISDAKHIVVYLPFENQALVSAALQTLTNQRFIQYAPSLTSREIGNVSQRPNSLHGFKTDLCRASGVICNAGFELISESLHLGIPVLAKPVAGQSEQLSNAAALEQLQLATVMPEFSASHIGQWLANKPKAPALHYPDVAEAICDWLLAGNWQNSDALVNQLWQQTGFTTDLLSKAS
jgi:uncharacterized protein (TIGR00661 family)